AFTTRAVSVSKFGVQGGSITRYASPTPALPEATYSEDVDVGPAPKSVTVTYAWGHAYDRMAGRPTDDPSTQPPQPLTSSKTASLAFNDGVAQSSFSARQVSETRWVAELATATGDKDHGSDMFVVLQLSNPVNEDNTQRIHIDITPTGCETVQYQIVT